MECGSQAPATDEPTSRKGTRWKLVGNAVSVPVAEWIGRRPLEEEGAFVGEASPLEPGAPWPKAAWGKDGKAYASPVGLWPERHRYRHLAEFLRFPTTPLSRRALLGFLSRGDHPPEVLLLEEAHRGAVVGRALREVRTPQRSHQNSGALPAGQRLRIPWRRRRRVCSVFHRYQH